jgi:hypothetical protein
VEGEDSSIADEQMASSYRLWADDKGLYRNLKCKESKSCWSIVDEDYSLFFK